MGCSSESVAGNVEEEKKPISKQNNINIINNKFTSDPNTINFLKYLTKDSYTSNCCDNIFTLFESIEKIPYLVYSNKKYSILFYNLQEDKIIKEIEKAHGRWEISNFSHFLDLINSRDLVISVSGAQNSIKIWELKNYESIINIEDNVKNGYINSACILNDNGQNFIIADNIGSEPIKIFDMEGSKIKELNESNEKSFFIDNYYDYNLCKNYIVTGSQCFVKSYDFSENKLYHEYRDKDNESNHFSIAINNNSEIIKLIDSCNDGYLRIWNFHSAELLKKIQVISQPIFGICIWNDEYIFVACEDKEINLVDINSGNISKKFSGHSKAVATIKKINIKNYGECLVSQGMRDDQIRLWGKNLN